MRNSNPKLVEILDNRNLKFKCRVCGQIWYPDSKRISWQCPNSCRAMDKKLMEKIKKYIKLLVNKSKEIKEVYLIGSLATGNFNKNSDIDLVICFNKDPSDTLMALETVLEWGSELAKEENKLEILGDILSFIDKFSMFKEIKPFMNSVYGCINKTLEIKPDSIFDFEELLVKNSIIYFVQEYINYSKITQKDQVFKFLADSLEKLQIQPLIVNLGLLLKPMYQDQAYISNLENLKEIEVIYNSSNDVDIKIKQEIDTWLNTNNINLENQDELREDLKKEFENSITKYNLTLDSEKSKKLELEVMEMLTMKLAMLSLMEQIPDDSLKPIPIK